MARGGDEEPVATDVPMAAPSDDEEAIRAKLRETGWKKRKDASESDEHAPTPTTLSDDRRRRDRDHDRDRDSSRRSHRDERKSHRSSKAPTSSRHRSRSASKSRPAKPREKKDDDTDTDPDVTDAMVVDASSAVRKTPDDARRRRLEPEKDTRGATNERKSERRDRSAPRKSHRSSRRHSRSRSLSRSSRRRRRHSRSRSPSRSSRRRRGASRSRSRSRGGRRSDRSRRRRRSRSRSNASRSRSRSRSSSRRRPHHRRSRSKDEPKLKPVVEAAVAVPAPLQSVVPPPVSSGLAYALPPPPAPVVPTAAPLPVPTTGVNPTITQLMQQHPTLSLQEIIAKMQASTVSLAAAAAQKPARELYVGNLPPNVTGPQLQEFLSTIVLQVGLTTQPGTPIVHTWLSTDGHFAFCEMRTVEECTLALLLNQLPLLNQPLKFGRPRSYMGPPLPFPLISERAQAALLNLGCVPNPAYFSTTGLGLSSALAAPLAAPPVAAMAPTLPPPIQLSSALAAPATAPADPTSNRLLMSNIPVVLIEAQVRELVEPFGPLKSLTLLLDPVTGASTGTAVFEYERASVTDDALQGLDGLDIGGIPLSLRRAPPDANAGVAETSDVVKLANMVSIDELTDDDEFSDLKEDVEEECKRFGNVVDLVIPRPQEGESVSGVGSIFVRFSVESEAAAALKALSGRKFGGNIVQVTYYPLARFEAKDFA